MAAGANTSPVAYTVVVPVYRGQYTLMPLAQQLTDFFETRRLSYQLIFVDDCSPDNSWQILLEIKRLWPNTVTLVKLARNAGQHAATLCGFTFARSQYTLTLDEDLQHPPQEIAMLIATQQKGNLQLVYGQYLTPNHSRLRNLASGIFNRFISAVVPNLYPGFTSFRLIATQLAQQAAALPLPYPFADGCLARFNPKTAACPVTHLPETENRKSAYNWLKLVNHARGIVLGFTPLPLLACACFLCIFFPAAVLFAFFAPHMPFRYFLWLAAATAATAAVFTLAVALWRKQAAAFAAWQVQEVV